MVTFLHVNKPMYDMLKLSRWRCVCYWIKFHIKMVSYQSPQSFPANNIFLASKFSLVQFVEPHLWLIGVFRGIFVKWWRRNVSEDVESPIEDEQQQCSIEDEQQQCSIEDEQQQCLPGPMRRPRKPKTPSKWPTDKIVVTVIRPDGMPTEVRAQRRLWLLARLLLWKNYP